MDRVYIFGSGVTGQMLYEMIKTEKEVVGFMDNDPAKWGGVLSRAAYCWK